MSKKSSKKGGLFIWFIIIIIIVAVAGVILGVSQFRKNSELKLSNANNSLNNVATDIGLVDKSEGSFYITLYVTAGLIVIIGVGVFIYIYKKADE